MASLSLADFFSGLALVSVTAQLDSNTSQDETGGGVLNRASYGTRLWYGQATIAITEHANIEPVIAKMQYLEEADNTFRLAPAWRLSTSTSAGTVDGIGTDRRQVTLSEARSVGDIFGIVFSSTKRSMHRVVAVDSLVHTVVPALPAGVIATDVVTFGKPEIDAVIDAVSYPTFNALVTDRASFTWRQTY